MQQTPASLDGKGTRNGRIAFGRGLVKLTRTHRFGPRMPVVGPNGVGVPIDYEETAIWELHADHAAQENEAVRYRKRFAAVAKAPPTARNAVSALNTLEIAQTIHLRSLQNLAHHPYQC